MQIQNKAHKKLIVIFIYQILGNLGEEGSNYKMITVVK